MSDSSAPDDGTTVPSGAVDMSAGISGGPEGADPERPGAQRTQDSHGPDGRPSSGDASDPADHRGSSTTGTPTAASTASTTRAAPSGPSPDAAPAPPLPAGPSVEGDDLVLRVRGFEEADRVRLWTHLALPLDRDFARVSGGWSLAQPLPDLDRLEYLLEVQAGEQQILGPDPDNPRRVGSAFGDHSWLPLPGYAPPAWLDAPVIGHHLESWGLADTAVGDVEAHVWSPDDTDPGDDLPLLVVHDGPEMDSFGRLTTYAAGLAASGRLPRLRVLLLAPGPERDARYAANPAYADVLAEVVRVVRRRWPSSRPPVAAGASLGALAALHAQWRHPGTFGGLWLASGSYFTPETDAGESGYAHWEAITRFVTEVLDATPASVPDLGEVTMVCGTAEENITNNGLLRDALRRGGVDVSWGTVRDGHNYTCWRDLFDPHLTDLLTRTWT